MPGYVSLSGGCSSARSRWIRARNPHGHGAQPTAAGAGEFHCRGQKGAKICATGSSGSGTLTLAIAILSVVWMARELIARPFPFTIARQWGALPGGSAAPARARVHYSVRASRLCLRLKVVRSAPKPAISDAPVESSSREWRRGRCVPQSTREPWVNRQTTNERVRRRACVCRRCGAGWL